MDPQADTTSGTMSKKTVIAKIFKVRKRREMLLVQVCFICGVLTLAWTMSAVLTKTGEFFFKAHGKPGLFYWECRRPVLSSHIH